MLVREKVPLKQQVDGKSCRDRQLVVWSQFFCGRSKFLKCTYLCTPFFPSPINLCISYLLEWKYFFFTIEIENYLRLSCFKLKVTIISLNPGFLSTPLAVQGNTEEEKRYEVFHTFRIWLTPLNLAKNVNF